MNNNLPNFEEIWVYLSGNPLFALVLTLSAYLLGLAIYERAKLSPFANPVLIAVLTICLVIELIDLPYAKYFEGAQFVHFLLGTATVSLAIPIYKGWTHLRQRIFPLLLSMFIGGAVSILTSLAMAKLLSLDAELVGGLYAKSVTAPIAMGIAESIGVSPTLTAIYAVSTGVIGAMLGRYVLNGLKITAWWQRGFAVGVASHGIGTSRAFSVSQEAGAYASLGMGMNGVISAILLPYLLNWLLV